MSTALPEIRGFLFLASDGQTSPPQLGIVVSCPFCDDCHEHQWPFSASPASHVIDQTAPCKSRSVRSVARRYRLKLDRADAEKHRDILMDFKFAQAKWKLAQK